MDEEAYLREIRQTIQTMPLITEEAYDGYASLMDDREGYLQYRVFRYKQMLDEYQEYCSRKKK